ncbi:hypothetical protein J6590_071512 [Homalodisca vitripennis]|nr:hypothetical protein J6590_071512 [Homalodisca vitripennis]
MTVINIYIQEVILYVDKLSLLRIILSMVNGIFYQSIEPLCPKRDILMLEDGNYETSAQPTSKTSLEKDCKTSSRNVFSRDMRTPSKDF